MRLVFFGSGEFGLPTLAHLATSHEIVAVVTQPDRPAGRGGKVTPTPIAAWAQTNLPGIPIFKPPNVNTPEVIEQIRRFCVPTSEIRHPTSGMAWVVIAFGQKLSRELLEGMFAVNLHASLLPRWRGAAPIAAAILAGDLQTGNSVITLAERMDAGLVLGQSKRPIEPSLTAGELHDRLAADGPALVEQVLAAHAAGTLTPERQDETGVTIATKLSRGDSAIDFNQRADFLRRQVHALTPWPGVTTTLHTQPPQDLKVLRVQASDAEHQQLPGRLFDPGQGLVSCGRHTALQLLEVQPPGKKPMTWDAFARGRSIAANTQITSAGEPAAC